tara:strand:- start:534 stop:1538 length:1005 start_codon:yes stop_codon:yes gene_type:complete
MAFQDNSGNIILDAVLTDIGRKRMSQGNFVIKKFALGDDEIDYTLFDANNPAGLQANIDSTPIMEAFGSQYSNINYGLLNFESDDILFIPQLEKNTLLEDSVKLHPLGTGSFFMAANQQTSKKIKESLGTKKFHLINDSLTQNKIYVESGIQEAKGYPVPDDALGRDRFILNLNLLDRYLIFSVDSRFFEKILVSHPDSYFYNDSGNNLYSSFEPLKESVHTSLESGIDNYNSYIGVAAHNKIFQNETGLTTSYSVFNGPRGSIAAFNLKLFNELTNDSNTSPDQKYSIFGQTDQLILGGSNKFDVIATSIYVQGASSMSTLTIPIKILRYSGT